MGNKKSWIKYNGETYSVNDGERALDAMIRRGAPVSFSCRKGTCRSCMLQATSGNPGLQATERLPSEYVEHGFFLPCCATDVSEVEAVAPDLSLCSRQAMVAEKSWLSDEIILLRLDLIAEMPWLPGQAISLLNDNDEMRSYSLAGDPDNPFQIELHIRIYKDGAVSSWIANDLNVGDMVRFQGPVGNFCYRDELKDTPLVLIGTGTGGGALMGIIRDAIARGHNAPISFYHGAKNQSGLYLGHEIAKLNPDRVRVVQAASREEVAELRPVRVTDIAFADHPDLTQAAVFLCGGPEMIEVARVQSLRQGARLDYIYSDPFEPNTPYMPDESAKFNTIQPEPELWAALGNGNKLTEILTEFYTIAYDDQRLAPFFQRTTKQRAIDKQYSFLQDLFSGTKSYFGEKPFNAHHWMVISDELFDHREKLLIGVARKHGIPEKLLHRWSAVHEVFRREIVKNAPRGILRQGVEHDLEGYSYETTDVGTVCDGCISEINEGEKVRMHRRTGQIFCLHCDGKTLQDVSVA
ncbi:MAG: FAD-binding oxidoreductase [Paracoccaceae bacterium]